MHTDTGRKATTATSNRIARPGASRAILKAKAASQAQPAQSGEALEAMFPTVAQSEPAQPPAPAAGKTVPTNPAAKGKPTKGDQRLIAGPVQPNAGTVFAVIVAIVQERGAICRADLVAAMAATSFKHPKAKPADKGWCAGYVAGGLRNGFLAVASEASPAGRNSLEVSQ